MNAVPASPFDRIPPRGAALPRVPIVDCGCVDAEGTSDACCRTCHGRGSVECLCGWCLGEAELTDIESRDPICLECLIVVEAYCEPISELLAKHYREIATAYRAKAEEARSVNTHDRRFYLERAEAHDRAATATLSLAAEE